MMMFKSFYLEEKRKTKLEIPAYRDCPKAKKELDRNDELKDIDTPEEITAWGEQNGAYDEVSDIEVSTSYGSIQSACKPVISKADSITIAGHLKAYFNADKSNFLRLIYRHHLAANTHLVAIKNILTTYGCGLEAVAEDDPLVCAKDTTITIPRRIRSGRTFPSQLSESSSIASENQQLSAKSTTASSTNSSLGSTTTIDTESIKTPYATSASLKFASAPTRKTSARSSVTTLAAAPNPGKAEFNALVDLYNSTQGFRWRNTTKLWGNPVRDQVVPVENWYGITVDPVTGHVIGIDLRGNGLSGTLPTSIGDLIYLQILNLGPFENATGGRTFNSLSGGIPTSIQNLKELTVLDLHYAQGLTGNIPAEIGLLPKLNKLDLSRNSLGGSLPASIFLNLYDLELLDVSSNQSIDGSFPATFAGVTKLKYLNLSDCGFTSGSIPSSIGLLVDLEHLFIRGNRVVEDGYSSTLPTELNQLTKLKNMVITSQKLKGSIPDLGALQSLEMLDLSANNLSGGIPSAIGGLHNLITLNLSYNQLSSIPNTIGDLVNLQYLWLYNNLLLGPIPNEIGGMRSVKWIDLDNNKLTGTIPSSLGGLTYLTDLNLVNNQLEGSIPPSLTNLNNLNTLNLNTNKLTGSVPAGLKVRYFDVENNQLSGTLTFPPNTIFSMFIGNNKFTFTDIIPVLTETEFINRCGSGDDTFGTCFNIAPQDSVDVKKIITVAPGSPLILTATVDRNTNPACSYQWFKYVDGIHDIALNTTPSTSGHTVTINNFSASNVGKYYYTISNPDIQYIDAPPEEDLTLTSRLQTAKLGVIAGESTTYEICLAYDENNTTIKKWQFNVDWNQVVARCMKNAAKEDSILVNYAIERMLEKEISEFNNTYRTNCLKNLKEDLNYTYTPKEYHYTLYYYDQAGSLVQTVPPKGVKPLSHTEVVAFRGGNKTEPGHVLTSRYQFSSLDQAIYQKTPDAGESHFYYDNKSQLRLSQNAQQVIDKNFSYTKYDEQGRIVQVGEMKTLLTLSIILSQMDEINFPSEERPDLQLSDVAKTYYDFADPSVQRELPQQFLRTRVAYVELIDKETGILSTHYSYDIHGNVKSVLHKMPGLSNKRTDYVYDLISGKVNYVLYQYDKHDQFMHQYRYDADNRIQDVLTSTDGFIWDREATYLYYLHGQLARVELGQYRVQGLDYYYSLQGWIKGVNMPYRNDPGNDGYNGSTVGRDAFAYTLGYYEGDYKPINSSIVLADSRDQLWARNNEINNHTGLFNGNISWMLTDLKKIGQEKHARAKGMQAMVYKYDQLNRLMQSRSLTGYALNSGFASRKGISPYDEDYTYDPNGNLLTLQRHNDKAVLQDDFHYGYYGHTNKLREVTPVTKDKVITSGKIMTDNIVYRNVTIKGSAYVPVGSAAEVKARENIFIESDFESREGSDFWAHIVEDGTYQYDAIGNLILDQDQGVQIQWTHYGKVKKVQVKGDSLVVCYRYDATGNRVEKEVKTIKATIITRYMRDASGNVMAIYNDTTLTEQPLYGTSRLGLYKGGRKDGERTLGKRNYELNNHLDNVLTVIVDNLRIITDSTWVSVVSASDYYPFGLAMQGRKYSDTTYRYGFNGKEKGENGEWGGTTTYDYGFRIYNPSFGRFLSVDPLTRSYPELTPYQFASNRPVDGIDLDGLEYRPSMNQMNCRRGRPLINVSNFRVTNRVFRQTTTYTPPRPLNRGKISYVTDNGKPHHGKPQQTSDFEGSKYEFMVTVFRGLSNLQGLKEKIDVKVESVTDYSLNPENVLIGKNSSFSFSGKDKYKLKWLEESYRSQVSNFINEGLNKKSQEAFGKNHDELSSVQLSEFDRNNPNAASGLGMQAVVKFGPSPVDQVIDQLNQKVNSGELVPQKAKPVEQPVIRAGN